jgi:hypothetical protein
MPAEQVWFDILWSSYPADLAHGKKGSKVEARKAIDKLAPDEALQAEIMSKLECLVRHDRSQRKQGKDPYRWPYCSTWIRREGWNEIEGLSALSESSTAPARACQCGQPVGIGRECWGCYNERTGAAARHKDLLKQRLVAIGMWKLPEESVHQWQQRCRAWCQSNAGRVLGKVVGGGA